MGTFLALRKMWRNYTMNNIINKIILLLLVLSLVLVSFVSAESAGTCTLDVSLINQEPYPAAPNSYVKLVFQVSGVENPKCEGAKFEFVPTYPFSLDQNEQALKILDSGSTYVSNYNNNWMVAYKVRVDKDAIEGDSEIKIRYVVGAEGPDPYITKTFTIDIEDTRTSFDAVIQDVSESEVSIALANVGKYTANSVVIRIPEQEDFKATKTNAQMVGNLESGDYTLAGFELMSNTERNTLTQNEVFQKQKNVLVDKEENKESFLKFNVHYTDSIGERRIVSIKLPLNVNYFLTPEEAEGQITPAGKNFRNMGQQQTSTPWWQYALIVAVVLLILLFIRKKYSRATEKLLSIFGLKNRSKTKNSDSENTPDWAAKQKK